MSDGGFGSIFSYTASLAQQGAGAGLPSSSGLGDLGGTPILLSGSPPTYTPLRFGVPRPPGGGALQTGGGYQITSGNDWLTLFASYATTNKSLFISYQKALFRAGYYGRQPPKFGVYTADDQQAWGTLIQGYATAAAGMQAAGKTLTLNQYLGMVAGTPGGSGSGGGGGRATRTFTDPASIRQTLQGAAQAALGRNLSDGELNTFVSHIHGQENAAYDAAAAGRNVTTPDASAQAIEEVNKNHGAEETGRLQAGYLDKLAGMLGVPNGGG